MTLFVDTRHYKPIGMIERSRDLFSRPNAMHLRQVPNAEARVSRFNLEALTIGEVVSTGHDVEILEPIGVSLIVPIRGSIISSATSTTLSAATGEALLFSPNRRNTRVETLGNSSFLGVPVVVSAEMLKQTADSLGMTKRQRGDISEFSFKLTAAECGASIELIQLVNVLYSEISRNAPGLAGAKKQNAWAQLLKEKLVEVLQDNGVFSGVPYTDRSLAARHARLAQDFMQAHYPTIEGVAEIANTCGISIRRLQDAFRSVWSTTPMEMLQDIRLEAARQMLVNAEFEDSVTRIAFDCGFTHTGRFAIAYRKRFGERPSDTCRACRSGL